MKRSERIDKREAFLLYLKWFNTKTTQQQEGLVFNSSPN